MNKILPGLEVLGGSSGCGSVSFISTEWSATARISEDGTVTCSATPLAAPSQYVHKRKYLPLPRTIRLLIFLMGMMTRKGLWLSGAFAALFIYADHSVVPVARTWGQMATSGLFSFGLVAYVLFCVRKYVGTWHGAEHMVFSAFENHGSLDPNEIKKESTISDRCGGRLLAPLILGGMFVEPISRALGIGIVLSYFLVWESVLWTEALYGWNNFRVALWASHMLQKYVTTQTPGDLELHVARLAMTELILAHIRAERAAIEAKQQPAASA